MFISPEDMALYLNLAFLSTLGLGLLLGLLKGFKRSLYTFIITLIFIGAFFLTVNIVVEQLYVMNLSFLGGILSQVDGALSSATSVQDAVHLYLPVVLDDMLDTSFTNEEFLAFVDSIGMFVLKIAYTIIYFTVIQFIYRFILFIIGLFIFRKGRAKNKRGKRGRILGSVFGTLTAAVNVFVLIIVLSGVMSIGESLTSIQVDQMANQLELDPSMRPDITQLSQSRESVGRLRYQPMAEEQPALDDALNMLRDVIEVYDSNILITAIDSVTVEDEQTGEAKTAPIILFDEVLSINYNDESIGIREDLRTFSHLANIYFNSDYYDSNDLSDIASSEIEEIFITLGQSKLLTNLIPVGIEVGIDYANIDLSDADYAALKTEIYDHIIWQDEIETIGAIAVTGFTILEQANAFEDNVDFNTVEISGTDLKTVFDDLAGSGLATYGAFLVADQVISGQSSMIQSIITVPTSVEDWVAEFTAFGLIAEELIQNDISMSSFDSTDPQDLIMLFAGTDLTILLESTIVRMALINILSGNSDYEINVDFLVIPDLTDEEWYSQLSGSGELYNILYGLSVLSTNLTDIDFDNLGINDLTVLDASEIDAMFESQVLIASISELILTLDTGDIDLIIPDDVLDPDGYIGKAEVKAMFSAMTMLAENIPCDDGNDACADLGFDITKVTNLGSDEIDDLFLSDILFATTSYQLLSFDEIIVPDDAKVDILVDGATLELVSKAEVKAAFSAITALGITDFENIQMDESLLLNLSVDPDLQPTVLDTAKTDKIFASKVLHATISYFLIDMTNVEPPETSPVIIPYIAAKNYDNTTSNVVRYDDALGNVTYISENELTAVLSAVLVLDIQDFNSIDAISFDTISANIDALLDSAILHATVSDQILQMKDEGTLVIPYQDVDGEDVVFTVGTVSAEETTYVSEDELTAVLDALSILDITSTEDINNLSLDTIDIQNIIDNDDAILASAVIHATISKQILDQATGDTLVIPSRENDATESLVKLSVGPVGEEVDFIAKQEIKDTLNALSKLEITSFDNINIDTSILSKLSVDEVTDPTTLDTTKSAALLASKIVHATISKLILDNTVPDEVTGEAALYVPYHASVDYDSTGNDLLRYETQDGDLYIIEEELTEIFRLVLLLDISDFSQVNSLDIGVVTANRDTLFDSAIIHATISDMISEYGDDGTLVVPSYNLDNDLITVTVGDALLSEDTTYIIKDELISMLSALETFDIQSFDNITVDSSIIKKLAVDPEADPLVLSETKVESVLSSKIIHATISKVIFDAAEPDELTGETDIIVPYVAETNYNSVIFSYSTDDVRFYSTGDTDAYIVEAELIELFRFVVDLGLDDFTNIDGLALTDILPFVDTMFDSAIIQATISDIILDFNTDGTLVVPSYDLLNAEIQVTKGDIPTEEVIYIAQTELVNTLYALNTLGITDFTPEAVNVDIGILSKLAIDPDATQLVLDENKSESVLASKIIHATMTKVILDAAEPDELTGDSDIIVPYIAETNYDYTNVAGTVTYIDDDVRFYTTGDSDEYLVEAELTELFRFVLDLGLNDLTGLNGLLLEDILPFKETMFKSAIIQATISDIIFAFGDDGSLIVPYYNLSNEAIRLTRGDALLAQDTDYITALELIHTLDALDVLGINDLTSVTVDIGILSNLASNPDAPEGTPLILDESLSDIVLTSKIVHATISDVIYTEAEPDPITLESSMIIPAIAEVNYNYTNTAGDYTYNDDDVSFYTLGDADQYIVQAELTELFRVVLLLNLDDLGVFNDTEGTLFATLLPHKDVLFNSTIIQATVSDQVLDLETSGNLVVPNLDTLNQAIQFNLVENDGVILVGKDELINMLSALEVLGITSFNNIDIDASILQELESDTIADTVDDNKFATLLSSKIVHATVSNMIIDAGEPDEITGIRSLIVPFNAPENYPASGSDVVRLSTNDLDEYLVSEELKELFTIVLVLDITDFNLFNDSEGGLFNQIYPHRDTIFNSAVIQATISDQILDIETSGGLVVPSLDDTDLISITIETGNVLAGQDTTFIAKTELIHMLVALNTLGLTDFNDVEMSASILLNLEDESNPGSVDSIKSAAVLASKIVHASISDLLFDSGQDGSDVLVVPYLSSVNYLSTGDNDVRFVTTDVDTYVVTAELTNLFDALIALQISDFGDVSNMDLTDIISNKVTLMSSAIIHATISKQIVDLDTGVGTSVIVPIVDELGASIVFIDNTDALYTITYLTKTELYAFFDAIDLIIEPDPITGDKQINDFDGAIDLNLFFESQNPATYDTNQSTLLASAILQATISDKISAMDGSEFTIPAYSVAEVAVEVTYGSDYFIYENEIKALINVMDLVGAGSIEGFSGTFTIGSFDEYDEQTILLASAIMHKTLTNQLINNNGLTIPNVSLENDNTTQLAVRVTTTLGSIEYITGQEIRDLIDVIAIMAGGNPNTDINSVSGTFSLANFSAASGNQQTLLDSAIMHATFSGELFDLDDDVLFIPSYSQDGEVFANQIKFMGISGTDYIAQEEVKAVIEAFIGLGYGDLSGFSEGSSIDQGDFFDNIDLYIASASFHATLSNKIFASSGSLIIPSRNIDDSGYITIVQTDVTYLEHDETIYLVNALTTLGLGDFSSSIDGSTITGLTGPELDTILLSGSMHLTIEDIIQGNGALSIPDVADGYAYSDLFALTDILVAGEVKAFILGASAFINSTGSGASISNVTFNFADMQSVDVTTRSTMLNSMIVRNMITPDIEMVASNPLDPYTFVNSDYELNDPNTFLTKAAIQTFLGDPVD